MQKLSLQQKLLQKLSPQQIQVIKLLELPTMQLEQRIKKELEENPVLELERSSSEDIDDDYNGDLKSNSDSDNEEFSVDDYLNEEDIPSYKYQANNYSSDDKTQEMPLTEGASFHEILMEQLSLIDLNDEEMILAENIVGNIDEDGYLRRDLESIMDDLLFMQNIHTDEDELAKVLSKIQTLDPSGVGASDLRECLLLQLLRKNASDPVIAVATELIKDHFDEFSKKHYDKLIKRLDIDDEMLKDAIQEVLKLNPKPGSSFSNTIGRTSQAIIPDFILELVDGELVLSLNQRNVPELRVNNTYSNILKDYKATGRKSSSQQKDTALFVKQKLDSAKWFIDAVRQRQQTLLLVMNAIINYQREYFMDGDETKIRPMILKDIADRTGLDVSTISRVSNSKYIQTHFGTFQVKYFFSEAMQKDDGEEVSTREIKQILKEFIEGENKKKPLTDQKLSDILKSKSYNVARRTIAKYREQMGYPVARLRKEI
ncbi:RNA polymerase factor sigma-54 [Halosquirtibacter xylanolyticus]|uniref:RNA polymerase factor sigma-54 n=1 Tax=Halosquirtibacter xylanolyticus TaxID=3374599 RepID=UPI003748F5A3|nr:RNA polymerase factor sigma-54 [Prolixibacteraceae bacterium]